jgi:hypothetical protein
VQSCISTYQTVRNTIILAFAATIDDDLANTGITKEEKIADITEAFIDASDRLAVLETTTLNCGATATGGPSVHAAAMAKPRHGKGGGGGTPSACSATFQSAVKKATRAEDRSFRKKHHQPSLSTTTATFDAAVNAAEQRMLGCLNNATF